MRFPPRARINSAAFVVPLNAAEDEYVNTVDSGPGIPKIVHHADSVPRQAPAKGARGKKFLDKVMTVSAALVWISRVHWGRMGSRRAAGDVAPGYRGHNQERVGLGDADPLPFGRQTGTGPIEIGIEVLERAAHSRDSLSLCWKPENRYSAGRKEYTVKASGTLPMDAEAIAIFPHAHYLLPRNGRWMLTVPDGTARR